jgi:hypothetical protein
MPVITQPETSFCIYGQTFGQAPAMLPGVP